MQIFHAVSLVVVQLFLFGSSFHVIGNQALRGLLTRRSHFPRVLHSTETEVTSPFESTVSLDEGEDYLTLTLENVEKVLDEMRPYLMADGCVRSTLSRQLFLMYSLKGNVRVAEIDGPVVKLELEGACGTCPSSTMTMKMGLEKRLKEKIPEIVEVIQALPDAPELTEEGIDEVLEGVRPFLKVAGGDVKISSLTGIGGLQPTIILRMEGSSASLNAVKMEIMQRVQRNFMVPNLRIEWE